MYRIPILATNLPGVNLLGIVTLAVLLAADNAQQEPFSSSRTHLPRDTKDAFA